MLIQSIGQRDKSYIQPFTKTGAGDEIRTRDNQLGKLVLYQLSYTRLNTTKASILASSPTEREVLLRPFKSIAG